MAEAETARPAAGWPERVRARLAELDPRFAVQVARHPFAAEIARGHAALDALVTVAEGQEESEERRAAALEAVGEILARGRAPAGVVARLAALAEQGALTPSIRGRAAAAVIHSGEPKLLQALMARLASPEPAVAVAAAQAMGRARHRGAVDALIELAARSAYPEVQSAAFAALGRIGDRRALEVVEAALRNQICLVPVLRALGRLGAPEHAALLTVPLTDASPAVRLASAEAIAELLERWPTHDLRDLIAYLRVGLEREPEPRVAAALLVCLSRLRVDVPAAVVERSLGLAPATD